MQEIKTANAKKTPPVKSRKDTKCLYMSGYTDNIIEQYHLNDNNKFFLQKPFNIEDLANLVRKILDNEV